MAMPNANNMLVNGNSNNGSRPDSATRNSSLSVAGPSSGSSAASSSLQQLPRPSSNARGNVAAFLTKLYNMVGDEGSNNLIKWSDDGQSFIVVKHVDFAKEVLPKFFKHNNFSSFVRQLNMYGFHKVPHLQQGVLLPDSDSEQWEFSNPHFQKNQPDLLCLVSRKKASNGNEDKDALTMDLGHILSEVAAIKKHQVTISADLKNIERDHQSLWQESVAARERHQRQQDTIDKILRFLASVFSGEKKRAIVPNSKKPRLTITQGHHHPILEEEDEDEDDFDRDRHDDSEGEHEEEVTKLLGSKRKRASMVESEADYILPGMESRGPGANVKPTFNIAEMTAATMALLGNTNTWSQGQANQRTSPALSNASTLAGSSSSTSNATTRTAPATDYLTTFPSASSMSSINNTNTNTNLYSGNNLSTTAATSNSVPARGVNRATTATNRNSISSSNNNSSNVNTLLSSTNNNSMNLLNNLPGTSVPFNVDGLTIPTTLLPNALWNPAHHDVLRSISRANAQEPNPAPLPPSFVQTPVGALVTKGVDDIDLEMERLQKSIKALEQHGLDVGGFNFDDSYLSLGNHHPTFDPNEFGDVDADAMMMMDDMIHPEGTDPDMAYITPGLDHQHLNSDSTSTLTPTNTTTAGRNSISSIPTSTPSSSSSPNFPTATIVSLPNSTNNSAVPSPTASGTVVPGSAPAVLGGSPLSTLAATSSTVPSAAISKPVTAEAVSGGGGVVGRQDYLEDLLDLDQPE